MAYLGYLGALLVGITLGTLGAGGSIITIPILIYLFKIEPIYATTYAFFIVGFTACIASVENIRKGAVQVWPALYFAIPGALSIYIIRQYVIKLIPDEIFSLHGVLITKDILILIFFSIIMICAGISMLRKEEIKSYSDKNVSNTNLSFLIILGFIVGIIIAFAGVGGGFIITPALIIFARLPIKKAIGTSLCIISINSFVGFFSSFHLHDSIDWQFLFTFVSITAIGILIGSAVSKKIENTRLKKIFGWFILCMGLYIILNELIFKV
jgi:uncharacterized protein